MGVANDLLLPYTACVMIELYNEKNGMYTVQVHLRNETTHQPYLLHVPQCPDGNYCPLSTFSLVLKSHSFMNIEDWAQSCGITQQNKSECNTNGA